MYGAAFGASLNGLASLATSAVNSSFAKEAAERSYRYSLKYLRAAPKAQRMGLEAAGYNPMMALGNIGAGTFSGGGQTAQMEVPDIVGGAKAGAEIVQHVLKGYKLQNKKTEKEIENLESDLSTKETQRLQAEANTSLALSQTERSDLAYGRDIVGTAADIAGTAGSLYSAKAMSDVAKANAATAARNATVNERRLDTNTTEVRRDKKGRKLGEVERTHMSMGEPTVKHTPKAPTPNVGGLGHSAKRVSTVAKEVAHGLMYLPYLAPIGAAAWGAAEGFSSDDKSTYKRMEKAREKSYWSNVRLR